MLREKAKLEGPIRPAKIHLYWISNRKTWALVEDKRINSCIEEKSLQAEILSLLEAEYKIIIHPKYESITSLDYGDYVKD